MMNYPELVFDTAYIENELVFSGAGGKENLLIKMFKSRDVQRVNHRFYDFVVDGEQLEMKRQKNTQWFDHGKFHAMDQHVGKVLVLFVLHDGAPQKSKVTHIAGIRLQALVDLACSDEECRQYGWTTEVIEDAHRLKTAFPALEHKAKLHVRKLVEKYPNSFKLYYERVPKLGKRFSINRKSS